MTNTPMSRTPDAAAPPPSTLADLRSWITGRAVLTPLQRRDQRSAVDSVVGWIGRHAREISARPEDIRRWLKPLNAAAVGVSSRTWSNVLSLLRKAQREAGLATMPGRHLEPMSPAWAGLVGPLEQAPRLALSRFARWCGARGVEPDQVRQETFDDYLMCLKDGEPAKDPRASHKGACRAWNRGRREIASWPRLVVTVPDYRNTYIIDWSRFPISLKADADAWLASRADPDPFADGARPLKLSSLAHYAYMLHESVSALVHRGRDPMTLFSLADLIAIESAKEALRFFIGRSRSKKPVGAVNVARMLKVIAAHWVKVDEAHLKTLGGLCKNLAPPPGMVDKVREKLRQFDDPRNVDALVTLPERLAARSRGKRTARARALEIQIALMIEILLMLPLRVGNLARLDLVRHIRRSAGGRVVHISIPADETKNDAPIEALLPPCTVRLLDLYLRDHRPLLLSGPSDALFPGLGGRPKSVSCMSFQIKRCIWRETGLDVNVHLFRHFAAKTFLEAHPGAYPIVQQALNHKQLATTTGSYCGTEHAANFRHFDDHILKLREDAAKTLPRERRRTGR